MFSQLNLIQLNYILQIIGNTDTRFVSRKFLTDSIELYEQHSA